MIKVLSRKIVSKDTIKEFHQISKYVPDSETWYAFEIPINDIDRLELVKLKIYPDDPSEYKITLGVTVDNILISTTMPWNDILFCMSSEDDVDIVESDHFGYHDMVYKVKYLAAPIGGYWDGDGNPIVINKKRK